MKSSNFCPSRSVAGSSRKRSTASSSRKPSTVTSDGPSRVVSTQVSTRTRPSCARNARALVAEPGLELVEAAREHVVGLDIVIGGGLGGRRGGQHLGGAAGGEALQV